MKIDHFYCSFLLPGINSRRFFFPLCLAWWRHQRWHGDWKRSQDEVLGSSGEVRSIRIIVVSLSEATQNPVAMLVRELGKQKHENHSYLVQHNKISLYAICKACCWLLWMWKKELPTGDNSKSYREGRHWFTDWFMHSTTMFIRIILSQTLSSESEPNMIPAIVEHGV